MSGWLLNCCYLAVALLWAPVVLWKRFRTGKYRHGWGQKLTGRVPIAPNRSAPRLWLHAVSVGEVLQLRQVIARIRAARPDLELVVTTTTETGYAVAAEQLKDCQVAYFPLDFTWSVRGALDRIQPDLIALVELELWPNFIREASRRGIPLTLINGRLSARSFRGYRRIKPLMRRWLSSFKLIAVQAEEYRERFLALGADPKRTVVTGSIKFDGVQTNRDQPKSLALREWLALQPGEPVFIAGSTQAPEEQITLEAFGLLKQKFPNLRLVIVPRHPERGDEVAGWIAAAGYPVRRRSQTDAQPAGGSEAVGLLDTVGELGACWGLADVAFVGGSFTNRGGQNMLEPAAYGAAVCFGPNTWNFRQTVELLLARDAVTQLQSPSELAQFVERMLADPAAAREMGARAQQLVLSQQGATDRTIAQLLAFLPSPPVVRSKAA